MKGFLPMLRKCFLQLLPNHSPDSVLIQKQIFKIFYAVFQVVPQCRTVWGSLA